MAGASLRRSLEAQKVGRANGGRQQMPAGVGRTLLTGRSGIGAGHQDRLPFALEPLLQADYIVLGPVRLVPDF